MSRWPTKSSHFVWNALLLRTALCSPTSDTLSRDETTFFENRRSGIITSFYGADAILWCGYGGKYGQLPHGRNLWVFTQCCNHWDWKDPFQQSRTFWRACSWWAGYRFQTESHFSKFFLKNRPICHRPILSSHFTVEINHVSPFHPYQFTVRPMSFPHHHCHHLSNLTTDIPRTRDRMLPF